MRSEINSASSFLLALIGFGAMAASASAQQLPALQARVTATIETVYNPATQACAPVDLPDINPRAFRAADNSVVMFALHFVARTLRGPDLGHVKIDCNVALNSTEDADPARYDGRRYITAVWSPDGTQVSALIHNEYHGDHHAGRCTFKTDLACWYNTILAFQSSDGATSFVPSSPLVVAAAPFKQDVGQGRHRGFFNPSNMFGKDGFVYALTSTTGWDGQQPGPCLIRNANPLNSAGWRGWDGQSFSVRWDDPYGSNARLPTPCAPLAPFGYAVGSVTRHRSSGQFVALWDAPRIDGKFPVAGFYVATSRDLLNWSAPGLLMATPTLHEPCGRNNANRDGIVTAYPALLDDHAQGRNFDDTGDEAWLYYTRVKNNGCIPGAQRLLVRQKVLLQAIR